MFMNLRIVAIKSNKVMKTKGRRSIEQGTDPTTGK